MSARKLLEKYWYIDLKMIAKCSSISYGMLRHYKSGTKKASDDRIEEIKTSIKHVAMQLAAEILEDVQA